MTVGRRGKSKNTRRKGQVFILAERRGLEPLHGFNTVAD